MAHAEEMRKIADHIVSSYEARIQSIGALFDATHQVLQTFQDSLLDTRQERERLNGELRENLARNRSLRKRDFDDMMRSILLTQEEREKEVRNLLSGYLNEQKEMSLAIRENLWEFKDSLIRGEAQRVMKCQEMIKDILAEQEKRRKEVTSRLKAFRGEQMALAIQLKELLAKGKALRIRDLKWALQGFRPRPEKRFTPRSARKEEIRQLLDEFRKKRTESLQNWRIMRSKLAQMN